LYGSKPHKKFKSEERKWFGGKLGGHVGIETAPDQVFNFVRSGKFHVFTKQKDPHSRFAVHPVNGFWGIFRTDAQSVKRTSVVIPINLLQKLKLDSIQQAYLNQTPYDYAFFGMRCGAATYEILAQLGILKPYTIRKTYHKIFYPRRLRKRLLRKAEENEWKIIRIEGTSRRKWEKD
jgi:hypothetical protein